MSQPELLRTVVQALEAAGVEYMLTGSLASSLQGEPRATHDIDLVVAMPESAVPPVLARLPAPEFYADEAAARAAVRRRGMFNVIDTRSADKVDFWMLTDAPFDASRFARRTTVRTPLGDLRVSAPEDTILMKLKWAKDSGGSEKQFTDALGVFEVQFGRLDLAYVERWVADLDLGDLWARLRAKARPI